MAEKKDIYENHEERIKKLERALHTDKGVVRIGGSVGGGILGYVCLGPIVRDLAMAVGETLHGVEVANKIVHNYFSSKGQDKYIDKIEEGARGAYRQNLREENLLNDASKETLEAMQRGSLKVPTVESKPVKSLRGVKGWIIEKTRGIGVSEEKKEEIKMQNTPEYRDNYNSLAALRMSAIEKRELLKGDIASQSKKIELNEYNTGKIDERGVKILEDLVKQYNNMADVLRNIKSLDVRMINKGVLDENYTKVVSDAKEYGVVPYSAEAWGDGGLAGASILGAYLGYKISRPVARIANELYGLGRDGIKVLGKVGRKVINKVKTKKLNSDEKAK